MARSKSVRILAKPGAWVGSSPRAFVAKCWVKIVRMLAGRRASSQAKKREIRSNCEFCKTGQMVAARISLVTRSGQTACEVTGVPADVCMDCGQYRLDPRVGVRVQNLLAEDTQPMTTRGMAKLAYRHKRVRANLPGTLHCALGGRSDVTVINLSSDGAMIEHVVMLSRGESCILGLQLARADLYLPVRVVWNRVHSAVNNTTGEEGLPFRSGLRFHSLPEAATAQIQDYLSSRT